jgi:quinol-cytochrome oxidoreductase complex cytochrome b subunit
MSDKMRRIMQWIDERTGLGEWLRVEIFDKRAPRFRSFMDFFGCFGGLSLVIFLLQVLSGMLLLVYYVPHTECAGRSIALLTLKIPYGLLLRRVHAVGASYMVVLVLIHMLRVFFTQAYKPPRELHWLSGMLLLLLVLAMNFTGYLLPWAQRSYWAVTVGTSVPRSIPLIGEWIVYFLRGGQNVSDLTLGRFYMLHVALLPLIIAGIMILHFIMIRKTGISRPL